MDTIINSNYYTKCQSFVAEILEKEWISEEKKNAFVKLFESLNQENAKEIFEQVCSLYNSVLSERRHDLTAEQIKVGGYLFVGGALAAGAFYGLNRFCINKVTTVCLGVSFLGFIIILSSGH